MSNNEQTPFRFIPLGGLDEVGMNCAVVEYEDTRFVVDCGITFPESGEHGVDIILPEWSYLEGKSIDAVLLTHGHEDHIGAVPFFLEKFDSNISVYGSRLTMELVEDKLDERNIEGPTDLRRVFPGDQIDIDGVEIEFITVNHSVPDAMSIALTSDTGTIVVTGDWKLDQNEMFEPMMDIHRFASLGEDGILGLFGDSTNALVPGHSRSEMEVEEGLRRVVAEADGRVIVAQFSSNQYRVAGLLQIADELDRKLCILGRSLLEKFFITSRLGYFDIPSDDILIKPHEIEQHEPEDVLILSTGSQAEPRASLSRMGFGEHRALSINSSDTVVISARKIPGNERGINNMLNNLAKQGANVITNEDNRIHATGHACREELRLMINLTQPQWVVPVHGEYRMRKHHADLADDVGVGQHRLIENGDILELNQQRAEVVDHVHAGRSVVDGDRVGDLESLELRDRGQMADSGIVVSFVVIDLDTGKIRSGPELFQRGLLGDITDVDADKQMEHSSEAAKQAILRLSDKARKDPREVEKAMRGALRKHFQNKLDRTPVVVPVVHEL